MSLEFELYEEKRRKLRRLSFLKGSLVTLVVVSLVSLIWSRGILSYPHIAIYNISGEIYDDPERDIILSNMAQEDSVHGVVLRLNSPGGTVVGAEALYDSIENISKRKPVIVSIGEVGASAAYLAALAGDKIFARGNSLVGSIGVIVQYPDLSKLADFLGISMRVIKSGEAKGGPNFLDPLNEKVLKNQESLVNDSFVWFKGLVSQNRNLKGAELEHVTKGELFTGRMALELGLIDALGSVDKAVEYLQTQGEELSGLAVKDWSLEKKPGSFWKKIFGIYFTTTEGKKIKFMRSPMLFSIAG